MDQLCSEVKAGHESGVISFKGAVKRITDMGDVRYLTHTGLLKCAISLCNATSRGRGGEGGGLRE